MATIQVKQIAAEINAKSKDIVDFLKEQGFEVTNHLSQLDGKAVLEVRKKFAPDTIKRAVKSDAKHTEQRQNKTGPAGTSSGKASHAAVGAHTGSAAALRRPVVKAESGTEAKTSVKAEDRQPVQQESSHRETAHPETSHMQQQERQMTVKIQEVAVEKAPQETQKTEKAQENTNVKQELKVNSNTANNSNTERTVTPSQQGTAGNVQSSNTQEQGNRLQGERSQSDRPQGDRPQSDRPQGDRPQGERSYGNRPQGDRPYGNRPQGDRPYGNRPQGDRPQGDRPYGNRPQGDRPQGDRPYGNRPQGDRPQGDRPYGNRPQGDRPQGDRPYGNRPQGDRPQGDRPYGNRPQGDRPYGNRPQGDRPQGDRPYGNRPQGDRPYGNRPQGDRPQGDRSYGSNDRRGQGGRPGSRDKSDIAIPAAPKDDRIVKTSNTRDKEKEREREREKERTRGDSKERGKRVDKTKQGGARDFGNKKTKDPNRKGAFIMPKPVEKVEELVDGIRNLVLPEILTIKELAEQMKTPVATVVKKLFLGGKMYSINQEITYEEAEEIALEFNCIAEREVKVDVIEELLKEEEEETALMKRRPPVVCVMGHVDHGKTSLLDAIRETNVTSREAGGITQHIGAYVVESNGQKITFLDTPGHEAFTSMRMRGAQSTDIAILVVAADDGVMPQTVEAINHAKAAGVEIIVAINKVDKPSANIDKVKQELVEHELISEDWGGSTVFVPVSAHTKEGIDQLLEMILLTADVCELKANPDRKARGIVIEAQLDKGRGPVATVLVQKGTLLVGDSISIGSAHGKVRAMMDDKGRRVKSADPSTPVEILGLDDVPNAGEIMMAFDNEKEARSASEIFISQGRVKLLDDTKAKLSLDGLFSQIQAGNIKELNLIIKADVQGSVEAVKQSLLKLSNEEVAIRIIHGGVGAITESDVTLASASNAIVIGFNVRPDATAKEIADREKVDVRLYRVIYNAIEDIEAAMKGMLDPIFEEKVIAHAEIRQIFKASGIGNIAGSYVLDGKITRGCKARITRASTKIYEGELASLKRGKDDVKEVAAGYECGMLFDKFNEVEELDIAELYIMVEVPR